MAFKIDNQTINDLKIIGDAKGHDIYGLYNKTKTRGGAKILQDMFLYPLSRAEEINHRVNTIRYFKENEFEFPFNNAVFDTIEFYLSNTDERTRLTAHADNLKRKFDNMIGSDTEYQQINKGVAGTLEFLIDLNAFISKLDAQNTKVDFHKDVKSIQEILNSPNLAFVKKTAKASKISYAETVKHDKLLRFTIQKEILKLLHYAYQIDVFIAVSKVGRELDFAFAEINSDPSNLIEMKGIYHPLVLSLIHI